MLRTTRFNVRDHSAAAFRTDPPRATEGRNGKALGFPPAMHRKVGCILRKRFGPLKLHTSPCINWGGTLVPRRFQLGSQFPTPAKTPPLEHHRRRIFAVCAGSGRALHPPVSIHQSARPCRRSDHRNRRALASTSSSQRFGGAEHASPRAILAQCNRSSLRNRCCPRRYHAL